MKKTYKLSIPYLGKVAVVTVVSFSCAISAYQLSQNSSIFSPRSKALELKNNQVIFSNQDQQTHTHQEPDESQYLKENQQSLDKTTLFTKKSTIRTHNITNKSKSSTLSF